MTNETQAAVPSIAEQAAAASKPVGTKAKRAAKRPGPVTVTKAGKVAKAPAKKAGKVAKAPTKKAGKVAKAPAKKAKPSGNAAERLVPADLETYVKDSEHKTAGGNVSIHCNDAVANKLLGKTLDQCYAIVAKAIKEDEKALRAKYKHLNIGMQRMSLGNRMRGAGVR